MLDVEGYPKEYAKKRLPPCIHAFGCPEEQPQHIMGLDGNIRDEFSRMLYGARLSLMIGITTVSFAIIIGTVLGAIAGYFGGWIDNAIMRVMDVLLAFPSLLLAIAIVTVIGPGLHKCPARDRHCLHPCLCARRARQRALRPRNGFCLSHARAWWKYLRNSLQANFAKCANSADRTRHTWELPLQFWMPQHYPSLGWVLSRPHRNGGQCLARNVTRYSPRRTLSFIPGWQSC